MQLINTIDDIRAAVAEWRAGGERIGFVPTMGNLHDGHFALVEEARARGDRVVVSIFVNPTQFGPTEDYAAYPRTLDADCAALKRLGVDAVFAPAAGEMYPNGSDVLTCVDVPALSEILCGMSRPGHFVGVATVVAKLFNIVLPDLAVFGRKDYQQYCVIRRMVGDLNMPVEVIGSPTVREADGLAKSSRNAYLADSERDSAVALYRALREVVSRLESGERDWTALESAAAHRLAAAGFQPDYVSIRRQDDLATPQPGDRDLVVLGAGRLGRARLIDNLEVTLP